MAKQAESQHFLFYSVLMHLILLAVLVIGFEWNSPPPVLKNSDQSNQIVNAFVTNDLKVQMPKPSFLPPPKAVEPPKKTTPPTPLPAPAKPPEPVKKAPAPTPVPQKNAIALPDPKKKLLQQQEIEKQLLADMKKQVDQQKKAKQKALEAAFAKELKATAAKSLEEQMQKESDQMASANSQKMRGIIDKYQALILQAISQNWLVPNNVNKKLSTQLLIRLAPGGLVLDVQVVKSSGDLALDRSARAAVLKASPLPVPTAADEFETFRQFSLKVKPENITPS